MKTMMVFLLACWTTLQLGAAQTSTNGNANSPWLTNLPKAQAQAKAEKKMLLLNFTGSDWCPPCKMLESKVFATPTFKEFAKTNLVLVLADFPRRAKLPEAQAEANQKLAKENNVEGFPTVIIFNSEGKEISKETGYDGETAKEFVTKLENLKSRN